MISKNLTLDLSLKVLKCNGIGSFEPVLEKPKNNALLSKIHLTAWLITGVSITKGLTDPLHFHDMLSTICAFVYHIIWLVKFAVFILNRSKIHGLIQLVEVRAVAYNKTDQFLGKANRQAKIVFIQFVIVCTVSGIVRLITPCFSGESSIDADEVNLWEVVHLYSPYEVVIFERYGIVRIFVTIYIFYGGFSQIMLDIFTIWLFTHIGYQFDAVSYLFSSIKYSSDVTSHKENLEEDNEISNAFGLTSSEMAFSEAVDYHVIVLKFAGDLQSILSLVFMSQIIGTGIPLCSCMLMIVYTMQGDDVNLMFVFGNALFFMIIIYQLYFIAKRTDTTIVRAQAVADAVYTSDWYEASPAMRRRLLMVMLISQNSVGYSALGVFPMNVNTFTRILKNAYAFFSLLTKK